MDCSGAAAIGGQVSLHCQAQVRLARRLALEWQAYVVRTHALRKVFVTVKGFHYQVL